MAEAYVFYNPLAGNGQVLEDLEALQVVLEDHAVLCDMTKPETYAQKLFAMGSEDVLVLCGGDGTLNRFANLTEPVQLKNSVYYYPAGCCNDFARSFRRRNGDNPFCIDPYLQNLPVLTVNGRRMRFLTGVQFGLCPGRLEPLSVTVTVDGTKQRFEKVSMCAVMFRRFCAGGVEPVPGERLDATALKLMLVHDCGKLEAAHLRAKLRRGHSLERCRRRSVLSGKEITLAFDRPVCLYADGEALTQVSSLQLCR